jgi:hypothetical protein
VSLKGAYGLGDAGQEPFGASEERVDVDLQLLDWHSVYAGCADGSVNVTEIRQRLPADVDTRGPVCKEGARVQLSVHAYCHNVGVPGQPFPPGMQLPKPIRDLQKEPLWKDAYGIRMPDEMAALYEQMGEGLGMFHRAETLSAVIGDGDLPVGLELGLCARALYRGREAKIDVSPAMALLPDPPSGWAEEARENPFPVSYLVKVLKVEAMEDMSPSDRLACALTRRRRANACYAIAIDMPTKADGQREGDATEDWEGLVVLEEACKLYKCAIEMCRIDSEILDSVPVEVRRPLLQSLQDALPLSLTHARVRALIDHNAVDR